MLSIFSIEFMSINLIFFGVISILFNYFKIFCILTQNFSSLFFISLGKFLFHAIFSSNQSIGLLSFVSAQVYHVFVAIVTFIIIIP